jgi:hypothetical protein
MWNTHSSPPDCEVFQETARIPRSLLKKSGGFVMLDLAVALAFVGMILLPAMVAMRGTSDDDDSQFDD